MTVLSSNQIRVTVLASGSRGNATLVEMGNEGILIDAGLSGRRLRELLSRQWAPPERLSRCFLTHEHMDHVRGIKTLFPGGGGNRISANEQTRNFLNDRGMNTDGWKTFCTGEEVTCGGFSVSSFPVPHDAYDPCGFQIWAEEKTVVVCTDLGYATTEIKARVATADILVLEANYDEALLRSDTKRPWATKQRIMERHGHLSNLQVTELLSTLSGSGLKHILLAHISEDCNRPELAIRAAREGIRQAGLQGVGIYPTFQNKPSESVVV